MLGNRGASLPVPADPSSATAHPSTIQNYEPPNSKSIPEIIQTLV